MKLFYSSGHKPVEGYMMEITDQKTNVDDAKIVLSKW
jgi:hypothetical protein